MHMHARRALTGNGVGFDHARSRLAVAGMALLSLHGHGAQQHAAAQRVPVLAVEADTQRVEAPANVAVARRALAMAMRA
ncbi:hypothetical protein FHY16_000716 [Xanthomonas campestris]|nr:hypothetical protein [Xanthomonas euroxanthea]